MFFFFAHTAVTQITLDYEILSFWYVSDDVVSIYLKCVYRGTSKEYTKALRYSFETKYTKIAMRVSAGIYS